MDQSSKELSNETIEQIYLNKEDFFYEKKKLNLDLIFTFVLVIILTLLVGRISNLVLTFSLFVMIFNIITNYSVLFSVILILLLFHNYFSLIDLLLIVICLLGFILDTKFLLLYQTIVFFGSIILFHFVALNNERKNSINYMFNVCLKKWFP